MLLREVLLGVRDGFDRLKERGTEVVGLGVKHEYPVFWYLGPGSFLFQNMCSI